MFANLTVTVALGAFARVEGDAGDEEGVLAEGADALDAELVELRDLAQLGGVGGVRCAVAGRSGAVTG